MQKNEWLLIIDWIDMYTNIQVLVLSLRRFQKVVASIDQLIYSCLLPDLLDVNHRIVAYKATRNPNKCYFKKKSCVYVSSINYNDLYNWNKLFLQDFFLTYLHEQIWKSNSVIVYILKKYLLYVSNYHSKWQAETFLKIKKCQFYTVQYDYKKYERTHCLVNNDLHSLGSYDSTNHAKCMEVCNNNDTCGGFTVFKETCFFKSHACRNDLGNSSSTVLFLKQGNLTIWSKIKIFIMIIIRNCLQQTYFSHTVL